MKRRMCFTVLLKDRTVGAIQYFVLNQSTHKVYAVIRRYNIGVPSFLDTIAGGNNLTSVKVDENATKFIVSVDDLEETLFFIDPEPSNSRSCISRVPHSHGHSVFK